MMKPFASSETAQVLAIAMAKACPDGCSDFRCESEELRALQPQITEDQFELALADLERSHLVESDDLVNATCFRLTQLFFERVDPTAMGWIPANDGRRLAEIMLEDDGGATAPELHAKTGWPLRRFNPALQWLVDRLPSRCVKSLVHPQYRYYWILGEPPVRYRLGEIVGSERRRPA